MANETEGKQLMLQGRIVWVGGDLFKGKLKTEFNSNTPKLGKDGTQGKEWAFGLAVPKPTQGVPNPNFDAMWIAMHEQAYMLYPSRQLPPAFSMKYKDGDGIDHNGQPFSNRKGHAGHLVFTLSTSLPIKFMRWENNTYLQINDGIKCGDYVSVQLTVKAHGAVGQGKPGLYLNPNGVLFLGYGEEIINTPSGEQMFGNQAPVMPPGASATPLVPQGAGMMPTQPQQPYGGTPQYAQPGQPVQQQIQPNYGVIPQPLQPQQVQQSPQMPQYQQQQAPQPQQYQQPGMPPVPRF